MKPFKLLFIILLLQTLVFEGVAQEILQNPKRIYITLDVSGSMNGNKYVMANYAAQTIAVFSNSEDIVKVYYLGKRHDIGSSNGYKQLQIPFSSHKGTSTYNEISDLSTFLKEYSPDPKYQDWLFIIGDGDWNYSTALAEYEKTTKKLAELFSTQQLQVCYLQTGNNTEITFPFTEFLQKQGSSFIDIRKSDTTAASVLGNCTFFANKILGFSNTSFPLQQESSSCISFCSEFPLDHCILVYQSDKTIANEVKISSVECNKRNISHGVKGNPTTKPLVQPGNKILNGVVWDLTCPQTIPANKAVKICFNQDIKVQSLTLYPYVDVHLRIQPYSIQKDPLTQASPNCFMLCDKENQVLLKISATDKYNHKFAPPLMQKMDVKINVDGKDMDATFSAEDTTFQVIVEMSGDSLSYFSKVESPGYFHRVSPSQTIVKSDQVCPPDKVPLIKLPVHRFKAISFEELLSGTVMDGPVNDSLFLTLIAAGDFDETSVNNPSSRILEKTGISLDGVSIAITQKAKNGMCECAFPDTLRYEVTLRSAKGILYDGKLYEGFIIPVAVPVDRRGWWDRCWVYVIVALSLLVFIIYLIGLLKKNRFKKSGRILEKHLELKGVQWVMTDWKQGRQLRGKGFTAWVKRWLIPFIDERNKLNWTTTPPNAGSITFVAAELKNKVYMTRGSFNASKMRMTSFNPQNKQDKRKLLRVDPISIYLNGTYNGELKYESGKQDDEKIFRLIIIILLLAALAAIGFVLFILIKSIL